MPCSQRRPCSPRLPPAGPCAFVQSWAAFIIGAIGGLVYFIASKVNLHVLKVGCCRPLGCGGKQ